MEKPRSRLALVAGVLGSLGLFHAILAPLLIHLGWVSPLSGYAWFFLLGLLEALIGLLLGLIALYVTRDGGGRSGRGLAWLGIGCAALLLGSALHAARPGLGLPPINDISTDLEQPPAFPSDPSGRNRDMTYPKDIAARVRSAYPDLGTLELPIPPDQALSRCEQAARALGWEQIRVDRQARTLLAQETTDWFRFVDDVVVRVRPSASGSVVDVRSKSRDGRGDLGANARRIRRFLARLEGSSGPR